MLAISSGLPALPSGIEDTISTLCSVVSLSQFRWVAIVPGAIALHLIPYLPNSAAICFVIPRLAALATVYGAPLMYPLIAGVDEMLIITPLCFLTMIGSTRRQHL